MDLLYGEYRMLATGGSIGDALFFFASGFTLFLGKMGRFDNWYKRRINRIYPTVFAWAILTSFILDYQNDIKNTIINGGGWFVTCIMIYYVLLWFVRKFFAERLRLVFVIATIIAIISYSFFSIPDGESMYGATYYKWIHYFLFMLLGSIIGKLPKQEIKFQFGKDLMKLLFCLIAFYTILMYSMRISQIVQCQIITLFPLLGITYYLYKICNSQLLKKCYDNRYFGCCIRFVSGLCLEIYIVQYALFTDSMNGIFPLNIIVMFVVIFMVAYLLRCASRTFSQTFKDGEYNWREVFKLV